MSHDFTRRSFISASSSFATGAALVSSSSPAAESLPEILTPYINQLESYFTPENLFNDVSRGNPIPHTLSPEKLKDAGLTRETWKLEILADADNPAKLGKEFTKKDNTAIDFEMLLKIGEKHGVRFAKIMTCLNIGCPLGMGLWEGVPLRTLLWLTKPKENLRRVFYYGFHNNEPKQIFRSSLPVGRVLEDYDDLPPVIVCYKLNGAWLSPERGGPVRILVPEHYGYKSVKWLSHIILSNQFYANDTYGAQNNDVDSPMKTFAATIHVPKQAKANTPIPITGYAQAGISGLSKVQVWVSDAGKEWDAEDPYFTKAPWVDATILPPPKKWTNLPNDAIPKDTFGFQADGTPKTWPMRLSKAYWAALLPGLAAGNYTLRCRTIDAKGQAQPMPRPFKKGGRCDIEAVALKVE